ncbi:hypothetical protein BDY24DRAFT_22367 [Mrakia frigida]|uniref:uncharacterized protein n=1 Tax=Mrakia frigida TaxID=29902 RepID=UPI003FCBF5AF
MPPSAAAKGTETPVVAKTRPLQSSSSSSADTSQIIRDIKGLNLGLTKALETKPLSDPDVEFQRQNLRRRYQTLLFSHHPHPSSSSLTSLEPSPTPHPSLLLHVEGLWIQTTHAIIALHRAKITALSNPPPPPSSSSRPGRAPPPTVPSSARHHLPAGARPVELRKQLTKFRAFLSAEIAFYSTLAGRFVRSLGVEEARPFLSSLGIVVAEGNEVDALLTEGADAGASMAGSGVGARALLGRKVVTKLLVCLGDLERYREMYSERERERKGRLENGKSVVPEEKRFERAREVYARARELMPENGNPFNQLAVISTYVRDPFSATYFYLRALSIPDPFVTARGNLQSTLRRPLDAWKTAGRGADVVVGGGVVEEKRLKKEVVLLQAMFTLKSGRFSHQSAVVLSLFRTLLVSRSLAVDTILRTIVLPISSHWDGLFSRPVPRSDKDHARSKINVEAPVLEHVLDLVSTLLEVATSEIKETLSREQKELLEKGSVVGDAEAGGEGEDATNASRSANLDKSSQHLTAVLRRALPTLRIVSKWLIAHAGYLSLTSQSPPSYPSTSSSSSSHNHANASSSAIPPKIHHLWTSYSTLLNALFVAFPFADLQALVGPLEEDLEMKGYGPLGKRMGENWTGARLVLVKGVAKREEGGGGLHPNEEMLMRIWDLEKDGKGLASGEEGARRAGVSLNGGRFVLRKTPEEERESEKEKEKAMNEEKVVEEDARTTVPEPLVDLSEETPVSSPSSPPPASLRAPILPTKVASEPTPSPEPTPFIEPAIVEQPPLVESHQPPNIVDEEQEEEETEEGEAALDDADSGSHASALEHDLELASVSTETEDDPVNRAMRAALDDGESALGEEDEFAQNGSRGDFQDEDEDERIVWPAPVGRRDTVTAGPTSPFASGLLPPKPTTPIAAPRSPPTSSGLTAHDLLQQMSSSSSSSSPASSNLQREGSRSSNLLFGSNLNSNISSIWGSPVVGGGSGGGAPAPAAFGEPSRAASGNWGSFASNEGGGRMQEGGGGGFIGGPGAVQNNQFNSSSSAPQHQNYPSPELRFNNGPPPSNGFPSNGYPSSPSHQTQYQQQPSLPPQQYQQQQQSAYPSYNNYQPNLYPGLPSTNGNPSSTYRPQGLAPSGGFQSYSTPPPPSTSPLHGFQGLQQPRHSPSSSFGQQQQPWSQQQQQFAAPPPSAPPGLGQQQQMFPLGIQQTYGGFGAAGGARVNPWG